MVLVVDTRLYTLPCRSVRPSVHPKYFWNCERFSLYCSCTTVRDWIAVYPALFLLKLYMRLFLCVGPSIGPSVPPAVRRLVGNSCVKKWKKKNISAHSTTTSVDCACSITISADVKNDRHHHFHWFKFSSSSVRVLWIKFGHEHAVCGFFFQKLNTLYMAKKIDHVILLMSANVEKEQGQNFLQRTWRVDECAT